MPFIYRLFLLMILWLGCFSRTSAVFVVAQSTVEPLPLPTYFEWRANMGLQANWGKKCQTTLSFQVRADDDYRQSPDQIFGELGISYQAANFIDILGSYRYIYRPDNDPTQRIFSGIRFNHRLKPFDLSVRALLQTDLTRNKPERFTPRLQFSAQYDRKKNSFKPRLAAEFFYRFDYKNQIFSRYRIITGLDYSPRKTPHTFTLAYMYERNLNIGIPSARHILNAGYRYDLGNLLPKKKKNEQK